MISDHCSICPFVTSHLRFWQNLLPSWEESAKRGQKLWWDIIKIFDEFTSDSVPQPFPIGALSELSQLKISALADFAAILTHLGESNFSTSGCFSLQKSKTKLHWKTILISIWRYIKTWSFFSFYNPRTRKGFRLVWTATRSNEFAPTHWIE